MERLDIITKYFSPVVGGIEQSIEQLYSRFPSDRWQVTVHTGNVDDTGVALPVSSPRSVSGLAVRRYRVAFGFFWPSISYRTPGLISLQNFELLPHIPVLLFAWCLQVLNLKRCRVYITPHGGFSPNWHTFSLFQQIIKKALHRTVGVFLLNRVVEGIQVVSEWEREQLIAEGVRSELLVQIENGLEPEAYMDLEALVSEHVRARVAQVGRYVLQVGKVYAEKNYETTIRALALLPSDVTYVILGREVSASYKRTLLMVADSLGLAQRVQFWGFVRGVDKYYIYKHAAVLAHMALWENFCTVVHEALSQGVVCVVSNRAVLPHLVHDGENGFCVDSYDFNAEADKINFILNPENVEKINQMKARNRAYGLVHTWDKLAQQTEQFYNALK